MCHTWLLCAINKAFPKYVFPTIASFVQTLIKTLLLCPLHYLRYIPSAFSAIHARMGYKLLVSFFVVQCWIANMVLYTIYLWACWEMKFCFWLVYMLFRWSFDSTARSNRKTKLLEWGSRFTFNDLYNFFSLYDMIKYFLNMIVTLVIIIWGVN